MKTEYQKLLLNRTRFERVLEMLEAIDLGLTPNGNSDEGIPPCQFCPGNINKDGCGPCPWKQNVEYCIGNNSQFTCLCTGVNDAIEAAEGILSRVRAWIERVEEEETR